MYGQGNYPSRPPFQHRLPGPPPPPPFQQGPVQRPHVYQHGPPSVPHHVGQAGHPVYQHVPPGPPRQVPQLQVPSGISAGPAYLNPHPHRLPLPPPPPHRPLQTHGGSQLPHFHSTSQQQSQWAQNVHQTPPTVPTSGPGNVMAPLSQGQALFRGQAPQGSIQVHAPPPPPHPLPSNSFATSSFGSYSIPIHQRPHMPSAAPPLLPPPPPLPSSPPRSPPHPPASSPPSSKTQFSANIIGHSPISHSTFDAVASDSVDRVIAGNQSGDNLTALSNPSDHGGGAESLVQPSSLIDAGISHSPSDSDMDMEDDITLPNGEEQTPLYNNPNHGSIPVSTEQDMEQLLQVSWDAAKHSLDEDSMAGEQACSVFSGLEEQDQGPTVSRDHDEFSSRKLDPKLDGSIMDSIEQTEHSFHSMTGELSSPHGDLLAPSASAYVAGHSSEKLLNENIKGTSPFRLLQDYASDDSSEFDHQKHIGSAAVSPFVKAGIASFGTDVNYIPADSLRPTLESEKGFDPVLKSAAVCSLIIPSESSELSLKSPRVVSQAGMTSISAGKCEELLDNKNENHEINVGSSHEVLQKINSPGDVNDGHSRSGNLQKEDPKSMPSALKVDEFGRLVRENHSDCDSGDSPRYTKRRGRRGRSRSRSRSPIRARSRSRSRSPYDRSRKRSPRRRRERHGRSRSQSPKRHRSRSNSPSYRRVGDFGGDKIRRDKPLPACFDFTRGKCYRGASCRYRHHESDKTDKSRSSRSKYQQQDIPTSSKTTDVHGETETAPLRRLVHELNEHKSQDQKQDVLVMEEIKDVKEDLGEPTTLQCVKESHLGTPVQRATDAEAEKTLADFVHPESASFKDSETQHTDAEAEKTPGDFVHPESASFKGSETQQTEVHCSDQELQNAHHQPQQMNDPSSPQIYPVPKSATMQSAPPVNGPYLNQDSVSKSNTGISSMDKPFSSENVSSQTSVVELSPSVGNHPSHLPLPFPSLSQDNSTTLSQQMPEDHNLILSAPKFPLQHSQFPVPSTTSWNSLPPPPPPFPFVSHSMGNVNSGLYGFPSAQFQQNMPPRSDFSYETSVRPYGTEFRSAFQVGHQETYPTAQEPYRSSYHTDDFGPRMSNPMGQSHGGPGLGGEDCFIGHPPQDVYPKSLFFQDNLHAQRFPFPRGSPSKRTHTFPGDHSSPGGHSAPTSQSHSYLHQTSYGLLPTPVGVSAQFGEPGKVIPTMSRYTSDNLEKNQLSHLSALGGSRISNHFNPYASTFDQPLSSKFSSNILTQEKDTPYSNNYGAPHNLSHTPTDGLAGKGILPKPVGEQYDPLYDSIEPSSNSVKKPDSKQLDVEGNSRRKGSGDVGGAISLENDEYGETADAEVGAVENGSAGNPEDADDDVASGEVEIDQVKAPGKSKTSKDSKSMKLFKIAIADFVKEVLKPSWRQGNMSKEAFKTIVKKTVDKVSGAMKSHQVPKSRAKIDHYIDSAQRKLTKLVMGYVDKYVKA